MTEAELYILRNQIEIMTALVALLYPNTADRESNMWYVDKLRNAIAETQKLTDNIWFRTRF